MTDDHNILNNKTTGGNFPQNFLGVLAEISHF